MFFRSGYFSPTRCFLGFLNFAKNIIIPSSFIKVGNLPSSLTMRTKGGFPKVVHMVLNLCVSLLRGSGWRCERVRWENYACVNSGTINPVNIPPTEKRPPMAGMKNQQSFFIIYSHICHSHGISIVHDMITLAHISVYLSLTKNKISEIKQHINQNGDKHL